MHTVRHLAVRSLFVLGLAACGVPSRSGPAAPTARFTPTIEVVETITNVTPAERPSPTSPDPTETVLPTQVPFKGLAGPILLYSISVDDSGKVGYQFRDADGHEGALTGLVTDWPIKPLIETLSPDRQWLMYESRPDKQPQSAFLGLYSLSEGGTAVQLPLIAGSYEADLSAVSAYLEKRYEPQVRPAHVDLLTFQQCVGHASWSPDGRYVAYISQAPGPSPDVFVYDTQTARLRRITKDSAIACSVEWSPDGAWLIYTTEVPGNERPLVEYHRARADALEIPESEVLLDGYWLAGLEWLSAHSYVVVGTSDGGPAGHDVQVLDLQAGTATNLWPNPYEAVAVDPSLGLIAISTAEPDTATGDGLFLVSSGGEAQRLAEQPYWSLWSWGHSDHAFLASDGTMLVAISDTGKMSPLFALPTQWESVTRVVMAPGGEIMAVYNDGEKGLHIVNADGQETRTLESAWPTAVIWRPDGTGLAYLEGNALFSVDLGTGEVIKVYDCGDESARCNSRGDHVIWLP